VVAAVHHDLGAVSETALADLWTSVREQKSREGVEAQPFGDAATDEEPPPRG
jgi:hypothetical protein